MFNVKGRDLLTIDQPNDYDDEDDPAKEKAENEALYKKLGLSPEPFHNVHYYYPYSTEGSWNTYLTPEEVDDAIKTKKS